ncbi:MAG: nitroreductase family protein [Tannerellaceae bacterium]|nr:nitroreductase family protein [Tannerellaceae bacterium]MCD8265508.1 nitroreductase family protein [Tannerellaceae bacterium]
MNFLELTNKRCSIRQFAPAAVEEEKLNYVLEAARLAPSAVNYQPWYFIVVREESRRQQLIACYPREWFRSAPMYIIVCGDHRQGWKRKDGKDYTDIDVAITTEHICLAATEQGLGTCWVCNFDRELCSRSFNLPEHVEPVAIIPMGYPAEAGLLERTPKKRKEIAGIVRFESF